MNENFEFIEYTYFATMFGNDINVLEYYGVIKATKRYKESLNLKNEPNLSTNESKPYAVLQSEAKGTKANPQNLKSNNYAAAESGGKVE